MLPGLLSATAPTLPCSGVGSLVKEQGWGACGSSWADTGNPPRCPAPMAAPASLAELILSKGQRSRRKGSGAPLALLGLCKAIAPAHGG